MPVIPTTFGFTGSAQSYVVPAGVHKVRCEVTGAQGMYRSHSYVTHRGGKGGRVTCDLAVTPGETLGIFVGGQGGYPTGGWNGGGAGIDGSAGGGGGSDIRRGGSTLAHRVIIGGGGGGTSVPDPSLGYNSEGGIGALLLGGTGQANAGWAAGGVGGTQSAGGAGGHTVGADMSAAGTAGTLGVGGTGGPHFSGYSASGGGGGGGGFYGGGGGEGRVYAGSWGTGAGGGGGSGLSTGLNELIEDGVRSGAGLIVITAIIPASYGWTLSGPGIPGGAGFTVESNVSNARRHLR